MDLIQTLLGRINRELHRNVTHIASNVVDCLENYDWPGNIRELENILMKSVTLSHGDKITRDLLPPAICKELGPHLDRNSWDKPTEQWSLEEMEQSHILRVLDATHWHKGQSCEILSISRPRLRRMIRQYHLTSPDSAASGCEDDEEEINNGTKDG